MILTIAGIRHITTQRPFVVRVFWIAAQQHTERRVDKGIMIIALAFGKKEQHSIAYGCVFFRSHLQVENLRWLSKVQNCSAVP